MSNGLDADFVQFVSCIAGFKEKFHSWPTKVRVYPGFPEGLKRVTGIEYYRKLTDKIDLIVDPVHPYYDTFIAEDHQGNVYDLLVSGHLANGENVIDWLGIEWPEYENKSKGVITLGVGNC